MKRTPPRHFKERLAEGRMVLRDPDCPVRLSTRTDLVVAWGCWCPSDARLVVDLDTCRTWAASAIHDWITAGGLTVQTRWGAHSGTETLLTLTPPGPSDPVTRQRRVTTTPEILARARLYRLMALGHI